MPSVPSRTLLRDLTARGLVAGFRENNAETAFGMETNGKSERDGILACVNASLH